MLKLNEGKEEMTNKLEEFIDILDELVTGPIREMLSTRLYAGIDNKEQFAEALEQARAAQPPLVKQRSSKRNAGGASQEDEKEPLVAIFKQLCEKYCGV